MTGFGSLETAIEATREGAYDFISKPFKVEEVVAAARRALGGSRQAIDTAAEQRIALPIKGLFKTKSPDALRR